jgi:hypothetical protein
VYFKQISVLLKTNKQVHQLVNINIYIKKQDSMIKITVECSVIS